ncbi:MAG: hypothetical protein KatS3mg103_1188 [Phycisphaerales bacterium]|nr:MAG: hypothetical protein KatS3mg103_1188 [Phycisphaerales bacterium]
MPESPADDRPSVPTSQPASEQTPCPSARATDRLFVSARTPDWLVEALADRLGPLPDAWRPTPKGQHHLTILFIGSVWRRSVPAVAEALAHACNGTTAFELHTSRLVLLPCWKRPRVLAVAFEPCPALMALRERIIESLARIAPASSPDGVRGGAGRARAAFLPHVTLARVRRRSDRPSRPEPCGLDGLPAWPVQRVELVRSHLHEGGAVHEPLLACSLAAGQDPVRGPASGDRPEPEG